MLILCSNGLSSDIFDIDKQAIEDLLLYDVVEFIGGNPYYLLEALKKHNAKGILQEISSKKILIGWSAGALVMTPGIDIMDEFSPEMNPWGIADFSGMELTGLQIVPHYSKFLKRYDRFEERCRAYEKKNNCSLIRLNDGEGIAVENDEVIIIK